MKNHNTNFYYSFNPFNNEILGKVEITSDEKVNKTINNGFNYKCKLDGDARSILLKKLSALITANKNSYAKLMSQESGLSLNETLSEVDRSCLVINEASKYSKLIDKIDYSDKYKSFFDNSTSLNVISEPLDLAFAITPFNLPLHQVICKVAPAIASGTSLIVKPSEKTSLTVIQLRKFMAYAGIPEHLVQFVYSDNPEHLVGLVVSNKKVQLITYTGSVSVGKNIARMIVNNGNELAKYSAELGGNSSLIVCSDADLDLSVDVCIDGALGNSGQRCTAIKRILVTDEIADRFVKKLKNKCEGLKFGNPLDTKNKIGSVISENAAINIKSKVTNAIKMGAELVLGNYQKGAVFSPTILDFVNPKSDLVVSETFGPVAPLIRYKNIDEAINIVNSVNYKLAGAVMTNNKKTAIKIANEIAVGQFNWNNSPAFRTETAPFGGFGDSGNFKKEGVVALANEMRRMRTFYSHS